MIERMRGRKGFTVVELLVASLILTLIFGVVVGVHRQARYMQRDSRTEAALFLEGARLFDRIERGEKGLHGLMKARADDVTITSGERRINFNVDTNAQYTQSTADDKTMSVYFDNGDGVDSTFADNTVVFEKDSSGTGSGTLLTIARDVENIQFQLSGKVVTASVTVARNVGGQTVRLEMTRNIYVRN